MTNAEFHLRYGPVALVTGASSGIGSAFAEELARRGFDLVLTARRVERLEELSSRLTGEYGVASRVVGADLTEADAPERIVAEVGDLDIGLVVSNAGFNMKGAYEGKSASSLSKLLMVNCHAPMQIAHGFIPRLKARGKGAIIFTSSVEGYMGLPYSSAYSASKALVNTLAEGLWAELSASGIDVLALCPGATESEATTQRSINGRAMENLQPASEVATFALDNITGGPTLIPRDDYRAMYDRLLAQPRRETLAGMAENMRKYVRS